MTEQLRARIVARQPEPRLMGKVECDEVYVVAGHKGGHPDAVKKRAARGGGGGPDAGERPASHDSPPDRAVHRPGNPGSYR